jgi:hypothetical protein
VATAPNRGELFSITGDFFHRNAAADVLVAFVAEVGARPPKTPAKRKSDPGPCARFPAANRGDTPFKCAGRCDSCRHRSVWQEKIAKKFRADDETVTHRPDGAPSVDAGQGVGGCPSGAGPGHLFGCCGATRVRSFFGESPVQRRTARLKEDWAA